MNEDSPEGLSEEQMVDLANAIDDSMSVGACSICLRNIYEDEIAIILPCSSAHKFHDQCLKGWVIGQGREGIEKYRDNGYSLLVKSSPTCPLCRNPFAAGNFWNDVGDIDSLTNLPEDQRSVWRAQDGQEVDSLDSESEREDSESEDEPDESENESMREDSQSDSERDSDFWREGTPIGSWQCESCGQQSQFNGYTLGYALDQLNGAATLCPVCGDSLTDGAPETVVQCQACQAYSHWHD